MICQKNKPLAQEEVQLHHVQARPVWSGIRADLDIPHHYQNTVL